MQFFFKKIPGGKKISEEDIKREYSLIGERIVMRMEPGRNNVIGCVSSSGKEGVSSSVIKLGTALQKNFGRVLVIDANPNKGITKKLGAEHKKGLLDFPLFSVESTERNDECCENEKAGGLSSLKNYIHQSKIQGLSIIPSGINDSADVSFIDWVSLLKSVRKDWPFVIIDYPHLLVSAIAPKTASLIDGFVMIVRAHRTRREIVLNARNEIERAENGKIIGMILNGRRFFIPEFLYRFL